MRAAGPPARSLGLAAAGLASLVASRGFGTPALATFGVGLVALPALVTALVWLAGAGMRVERRIEPTRCVAGSPVRVSVLVSGWAMELGLDRILGITVDPGLGAVRATAAPDAVGATGAWSVAAVRGDHRLPPPRVTISDPFGLARRSRVGGGEAGLLVVPPAPVLEGAPVGTRSRGHGVRRRGTTSGFGELDRVRDYQTGDALSRVHWAQTAKRGRLQTKEMRSSEGSGRTILLLLDGAVPGGDAFETTVIATAALARHFAERREPVSVVHTGRSPVRIPAARSGWSVVEIALARVEPGGQRSLALALRAEATAPEPPDLIIALTCGAETGLLAAAAQARRLGVGVAAVLAGPAAATSAELTGVGVDVAVVAGPDRVAAALSGVGERARVS
jgi:uncharacterized protein (DUF58 family)